MPHIHCMLCCDIHHLIVIHDTWTVVITFRGSFGLWLDGDLYHGRTQHCLTCDREWLSLLSGVRLVYGWTVISITAALNTVSPTIMTYWQRARISLSRQSKYLRSRERRHVSFLHWLDHRADTPVSFFNYFNSCLIFTLSYSHCWN